MNHQAIIFHQLLRSQQMGCPISDCIEHDIALASYTAAGSLAAVGNLVSVPVAPYNLHTVRDARCRGYTCTREALVTAAAAAAGHVAGGIGRDVDGALGGGARKRGSVVALVGGHVSMYSVRFLPPTNQPRQPPYRYGAGIQGYPSHNGARTICSSASSAQRRGQVCGPARPPSSHPIDISRLGRRRRRRSIRAAMLYHPSRCISWSAARLEIHPPCPRPPLLRSLRWTGAHSCSRGAYTSPRNPRQSTAGIPRAGAGVGVGAGAGAAMVAEREQ